MKKFNITGVCIPRKHYMVDISNKLDQIEKLELLIHLEEILDANKLIFKFNNKQNRYSCIESEYLLESKFSQNIIYIFIDSLNKEDKFCRSFFPKTRMDYAVGQMKMALLYKEKINIETGNKVIQYEAGNYSRKNDLLVL